MFKASKSSLSLALASGALLALAVGVIWIYQRDEGGDLARQPKQAANQEGRRAPSLQSDAGESSVQSDSIGAGTVSGEEPAIEDAQAAAAAPQDLRQIAATIASLPPGDAREEAVAAAADSADRSAVPAALELLQTSTDAGVVRMSQEIFARMADTEALQSMLDIYDASADPVLRARLEQTVGCIQSEEAVPGLMLVLSDLETPGTDGMIQAGAQALRQIGTPPAVDALLERLDGERAEEARSQFAEQLREVSNPVAETSLQNAARGETKIASRPQTRIAAINTLLNYPSAETQELLASLASDPAPGVAEAAAETLLAIRQRFAAE